MTTNNQPRSTGERPVVVGHRGAPADAVENTMAAFEKALNDGADLLECDVHLTADHVAVIMHDDTIDRMAAPDSVFTSGAIADMTMSEIAQVTLRDGHRIPTLDELLKATTVPVFIEIKTQEASQAVAELLLTLPQDSPARRSTVISFVEAALAHVHEIAPEVPRSYLTERFDDASVQLAQQLGVQGIGPWIRAMDPSVAAHAHECGLQVNPWTINDAKGAQLALDCGADSITTDDPAWLRGWLADQSWLAD